MRGKSESENSGPVEVDETFKLRLGVRLGGAVLDALKPPVLGRSESENRGPVDVDEVFALGLGVALGGADMDEFEVGAITPPLPVDDDALKPPVRGRSEFVNRGPVDVEAFVLGLGVALGGADMEEFDEGPIMPPLPVDTDAALKPPVRGRSEFVNSGPGGVVAFALGLGVALGRAGTEELEDGAIIPPVPVDEEALKPPVRGRSELVNSGPVDDAFTLALGVALGKAGSEEFEVDGGMTPLSLEASVTAVLPSIEKPADPPADVKLTFGIIGVGATDAGGMTPFPPVEEVVAVPPEVVKFSLPEATVTFALGLGGIKPEASVADVTAVPPDMVRLPLPPVDDGAGGRTPESPVELEVNVLLLVAKDAPPDATENDGATVPLAEGNGGKTPDSPILITVAVEPDAEITIVPAVITVIAGTLEFETASIDRGGTVLPPVTMIGVMIPLSPVEVEVKMLPEVVKLPAPDAAVGADELDGYTKSEPLDDGAYPPLPPVDSMIEVPFEVVKPPDPPVEEGGGFTPSPPVALRV